MRCIGQIFAILAVSGVAAAEIPPDPCACSPNKPGFHRASALTGDWGGVRRRLFDRGVKIQANYSGEVFASPTNDALVGAGLAALAIDVEEDDLLKRDHLGSLHLSGFGIHGDGLSARLMDVYGVSNNVAQPGVRLFEAWAEQPIGDFALRVGLLAADQEFVLASHSVVLLNATFGILALVSYDVGNPVYPVAVPGASARYETEAVTVRGAVYDGKQDDDHGIPHGISDDAFVIGEAELAGTFKLGAWHHTTAGNGYYAIIDRQLERYVGTFARLSVAPDKAISLYADTGIRIGPGPLRRRDFMSMGLAFARTELGAQTVVEATYQYLVRGWMTVQPDAQVLLTRGGTAGVLALRAVVAL